MSIPSYHWFITYTVVTYELLIPLYRWSGNTVVEARTRFKLETDHDSSDLGMSSAAITVNNPT